MLQFHVALCCVERNVAHKVRRYIHLFVASELVSDVEGYPAEVFMTRIKQTKSSDSTTTESLRICTIRVIRDPTIVMFSCIPWRSLRLE
jgi:hypothetical protein